MSDDRHDLTTPPGDRAFSNVLHPQRRAFLRAFAACGMVGRSADAAGVHRDTPYSDPWRNDEAFQEAFDLARQMAADRLEAEARRRAEEGLKRYKFHSRTGEPLRHPEECECGHPLSQHIDDGDGRRPCPESGCEDFRGAPYTEHEYSDALMSLLLKGAKPETYRDRLEVRGALARLDFNQLPDAAVQRIAAGENPIAVLASMTPEGTPVYPALPPARGES